MEANEEVTIQIVYPKACDLVMCTTCTNVSLFKVNSCSTCQEAIKTCYVYEHTW